MITKDPYGHTMTTTFIVGLDVEYLPGQTIGGINLSFPYASHEVAELSRRHIANEHPDCRVIQHTDMSDTSDHSYYKQAVERDDQIREQYPDEIESITRELSA